MAKIMIIILYIMFGFLIGRIIYREYKEDKGLNSKILFLIAYTIYYVLIPIITLLISFYNLSNTTPIIESITMKNVESHFIVLIYILVGLFSYLISYKMINKVKKSRDIYVDADQTNMYRICLVIGLITFIIGAICCIVILYEMGGLGKTLRKVEIMRAYGTDRSLYMKSSLLFTHTLINISLVSPFLLLICTKIKGRLITKVLFIQSMAVAIFCMLFSGGRMGMILYFLSFIVPLAYRKMKRPIIGLVIIGIIVVSLLGILDNFIFYMSYGNFPIHNESSFNVLNEFAFPYRTLLDVNNINNVMGYRYGIDYFTWIINIIPSGVLKVVGLSKIPVGHTYITQYYDPTGATMGGVPTDILTLGIRQFDFVGVVINMMVIATICVVIDRISKGLKEWKIDEIMIRISLISFSIVAYSDLDSFIRNRYDMLILVVVIIAIYFASSYKTNKLRR